MKLKQKQHLLVCIGLVPMDRMCMNNKQGSDDGSFLFTKTG